MVISAGDQKTQYTRNHKIQGYSNYRSRKITSDQVNKIKPPRQGKFQVLIRKTVLTYLKPQGIPLSYTGLNN